MQQLVSFAGKPSCAMRIVPKEFAVKYVEHMVKELVLNDLDVTAEVKKLASLKKSEDRLQFILDANNAMSAK